MKELEEEAEAEEKFELCRCGRQARRTFRMSTLHASTDCHSSGSINEAKYCCHRAFCLIREILYCGFSLVRAEQDRVRRYGHVKDGRIPVPEPNYHY